MSASDDDPGTSYPRGGTSTASGGQGIFADPETEDPLEIWVDLAIPNRMGLIRQLQSENAQISAFHSSPDTSLLILSPRSTHIFDRYAHPAWLPPRLRAKIQSERAKAGEEGDNDEWKTKVLLKSSWVGQCIQQGRFLGEDDDWGGFRAGGPPRMLLKSTMLPPFQPELSIAAGLPISADLPSPRHPQTIAPASLPTSRPLQDTISLNSPSLGTTTNPLNPHSAVDARAVTIPDAADSLDESMDKDIEPLSHDVPSTPSEAAEEIEYSPPRPTRRPGPIKVISEEEREVPPADVAEGSSRRARRVTGEDEEMRSVSEEERDESYRWVTKLLGDDQPPEWSAEELARRREQFRLAREARAKARDWRDPALGPVFKNVRVWIDPKYRKRHELSNLMRERGATLVPRWSDATHIVGVPSSLIDQLSSVADDVASSGAVIVHVTWAWSSIHERRSKSEQPFLVELEAAPRPARREAGRNDGGWEPSITEGSASKPPAAASPAKTPNAVPVPTPVPIKPLSTAKSKSKGKSKSSNDEMDTETLVEIFTRHQELFTKGKAVPEIARFMEQRYATYPAITWRNLLIEWRKKSDRFQGYGQPIAPAKHQVSPAKIVLKSMPEPVHIHPTISYNRPSPIAPPTAHVVPLPAKAFMTTKELDKIFREETESAPQATIITIIDRILRKHGTYAHQGWDGLYRDWRFRRGRFAHLAATSATSAPVTAAPPERYSTDQLQTFFRHAQPGPNMTESDRGEALAAMFGRYSKSEWADLYNDWQNKRGRFHHLRGVTPVGRSPAPASAPAPNTPATATPAPSQSSRTYSRYIGHEELVKILQEHEPLLAAGMATRQLAEILAPEFPSYAVGTWYNYILDFRTRKGRFADVPKLSATRAASVTSAAASARSATASSETKRNLEDAQTSPRKKHRNAYTEEEEIAMAAHVFVRLPMETTASTAHWADFQLEHRHRSVGAWAEHYRAYKEKIGEYVARMGGADRARVRRAGSDGSDGSDGSVQFIREGEDKSKRPHEVIEVLDSDSE